MNHAININRTKHGNALPQMPKTGSLFRTSKPNLAGTPVAIVASRAEEVFIYPLRLSITYPLGFPMKMFRFLLVVAIVSNLSLAENQVMNASVSESSELPNSRLGVAPALLVGNDDSMWGANIEISFKTSGPLYLGLVSGFYRKSIESSSSTSARWVSLTLIPVMASAIYQFPISKVVRPYMGLAAGMSVGLISFTASSNGRSTSASATEIYFTGVARPGVDFALDSNVSLYAEPRLGIFEESFIFNPQVGISFGL